MRIFENTILSILLILLIKVNIICPKFSMTIKVFPLRYNSIKRKKKILAIIQLKYWIQKNSISTEIFAIVAFDICANCSASDERACAFWLRFDANTAHLRAAAAGDNPIEGNTCGNIAKLDKVWWIVIVKKEYFNINQSYTIILIWINNYKKCLW